MTKKWIIENGGIKDTGSGMTFDSFMEIIIVLNGQSRKLRCLASENEQLKLLSNYRGEMVSFATSLIQDMGSEEMLKIWNDFTEVMYQKWKKRD